MTVPQPDLPFGILPLTEVDLPAAAELSRREGWPHRLEDWKFALALGQGLGAQFGNRLVGTALWWIYPGGQARIGMVIAEPEMQRSGIGGALIRTIIGTLDTQTVTLNATEAGATLYRRMGFQPVGTVLQHQGVAREAPLVPLGHRHRIRPVDRNDRNVLIALDSQARGYARAATIDALIAEGDAVLLEEGERSVGFAFQRRFGRGFVIGPVVAADATMARALIAYWISSGLRTFQRIDVPDESGLSGWLAGIGLGPVDPVLTMVRGEGLPPPCDIRVFALATQALG